jgi:hypothetical protein
MNDISYGLSPRQTLWYSETWDAEDEWNEQVMTTVCPETGDKLITYTSDGEQVA